MTRPATADENRRRRYEAPELAAGVHRQVRSLVTRCEEGDTEALEELAKLQDAIDRSLFEGARALYRRGYTWQAVGDLLGITRQAASQRFRGTVPPDAERRPLGG